MTWSPTSSTSCLETMNISIPTSSSNTALDMDALSHYRVIDINNLSMLRPYRNETRERRNKLCNRSCSLHDSFSSRMDTVQKAKSVSRYGCLFALNGRFSLLSDFFVLNTCSSIDHRHGSSNRNEDQLDISEWEKLKNLLKKNFGQFYKEIGINRSRQCSKELIGIGWRVNV